MRHVVAVHQRGDDPNFLLRSNGLVPIVLLEHVQQAGNVRLVVPHHALRLQGSPNAIGDVLYLGAVGLGPKHLVERDLAGDGRRHLWLDALQVLLDFSKGNTNLSFVYTIARIFDPLYN